MSCGDRQSRLERRRPRIEARRAEVAPPCSNALGHFRLPPASDPLVAIHQLSECPENLDQTEDAAAKRQQWFDRCWRGPGNADHHQGLADPGQD